MMKIFFVVAALLFGFNMNSYGLSNLSDSRDSLLQNMNKKGTGTVESYWIDLYNITLWSQEQIWSYNFAFALEVECLMNYSAKEMIDSTLDAMARNKTLTADQSKNYRDFLMSFYPPLKKHDLITVIYYPPSSDTQGELLFFHNNDLLKKSNDMVFAKHFCDIWLDSTTDYSSVREKLLNNK